MWFLKIANLGFLSRFLASLERYRIIMEIHVVGENVFIFVAQSEWIILILSKWIILLFVPNYIVKVKQKQNTIK